MVGRVPSTSPVLLPLYPRTQPTHPSTPCPSTSSGLLSLSLSGSSGWCTSSPARQRQRQAAAHPHPRPSFSPSHPIVQHQASTHPHLFFARYPHPAAKKETSSQPSLTGDPAPDTLAGWIWETTERGRAPGGHGRWDMTMAVGTGQLRVAHSREPTRAFGQETGLPEP